MDPVWYENYDAGVPRSLDNSDPLLPHQLELMAGRFPRNVATEFFGAKLTYGELWDQVLRMAGAFLEMGAGRGKKVAIMLPNCPQTIIAYYAALWNGAVPVLTNPLYVEREMWCTSGRTRRPSTWWCWITCTPRSGTSSAKRASRR